MTTFTRWDIGSPEQGESNRLACELGIPTLAAKLLVSRGIVDTSEAARFLRPSLDVLRDPLLIRDMDRAVARIAQAVEQGERIAVYGDYDADGITATYILVDYLQNLGADCTYRIPDRVEEGYGIHRPALDELAAQGVGLIITVDTGITALEETGYAKRLGIELVICDHHECGAVLPDAWAVVDPHRKDERYPFQDFAGVGVAFKLICALEGGDISAVAERYLPFVCIGTIADIVPLLDENRAIAAYGLKLWNNCDNLGLRALVKAAGAQEKAMSAASVGFLIAPRINAAGRMGSASRVVELFLSEDAAAAQAIADEICAENDERKRMEQRIFEEALDRAEQEFDPDRDSLLLLESDSWHHGVIGIVASRLCTRFQRPVVLVCFDGDVGRGSGRSVKGVNLFHAFEACAPLLEQYGGHELAAGLTVRRENLGAVREALNRTVREAVAAYEPSLRVDFAAKPDELTVNAVRGLCALEPYGAGNLEPILALCGVRVSQMRSIGNGKHLRLVLHRERSFDCVAFRRTVRDMPFEEGDVIDVAFRPEINDFRGENVQFVLQDAQPTVKEREEIMQAICLHSRFVAGESLDVQEQAALACDYRTLGTIWRFLVKHRGAYPDGISCIRLAREISSAGSVKVSAVKLLVALDVFSELGFLRYELGARLLINMAENIVKTEVGRSPTAQRVGAIKRDAVSGGDVYTQHR